jgi:hypothetical protein
VGNRIAAVIESAIRFADVERFRSSGLVEALKFSLPLGLGEVEKGADVACFSARLDEPGELVRVYVDLDDTVGRSVVRKSIHMAVESVRIGVGEVSYLETQEGFKILLVDDRQEHRFQDKAP